MHPIRYLVNFKSRQNLDIQTNQILTLLEDLIILILSPPTYLTLSSMEQKNKQSKRREYTWVSVLQEMAASLISKFLFLLPIFPTASLKEKHGHWVLKENTPPNTVKLTRLFLRNWVASQQALSLMSSARHYEGVQQIINFSTTLKAVKE